MASATKERSAWDEIVKRVRQRVEELPKTLRDAASAEVEVIIWQCNDRIEKGEALPDDIELTLDLEIPVPIEDIASGAVVIPGTLREVGQEMRTLALEVQALKDKVEEQASMLVFFGSLVNGLMGLDTLVHPEDEDPEFTVVREIAQKTGATIRKSAGLEMLD